MTSAELLLLAFAAFIVAAGAAFALAIVTSHEDDAHHDTKEAPCESD
jgi:4-hydroxybenzoate polyprenyltransferase